MKSREICKYFSASIIFVLALTYGSAFAEKSNMSTIMIDCNPDPIVEDLLPVQDF